MLTYSLSESFTVSFEKLEHNTIRIVVLNNQIEYCCRKVAFSKITSFLLQQIDGTLFKGRLKLVWHNKQLFLLAKNDRHLIEDTQSFIAACQYNSN